MALLAGAVSKRFRLVAALLALAACKGGPDDTPWCSAQPSEPPPPASNGLTAPAPALRCGSGRRSISSPSSSGCNSLTSFGGEGSADPRVGVALLQLAVGGAWELGPKR